MAYCIPRLPIDTERSSGPIKFYKQNSAVPIDRAFTLPLPWKTCSNFRVQLGISLLNLKHCRSWALPIPLCLRRRAIPARIFLYLLCPTSWALDLWGLSERALRTLSAGVASSLGSCEMRDPNRAQVRTFSFSSGSSCTALQTVGRPWSSRSALCLVGRGPGEIHKEALELCNHSLLELSGNSRSYLCFFLPDISVEVHCPRRSTMGFRSVWAEGILCSRFPIDTELSSGPIKYTEAPALFG